MSVFHRVQEIQVTEDAGYQHFLLFYHCCQKGAKHISKNVSQPSPTWARTFSYLSIFCMPKGNVLHRPDSCWIGECNTILSAYTLNRHLE